MEKNSRRGIIEYWNLTGIIIIWRAKLPLLIFCCYRINRSYYIDFFKLNSFCIFDFVRHIRCRVSTILVVLSKSLPQIIKRASHPGMYTPYSSCPPTIHDTNFILTYFHLVSIIITFTYNFRFATRHSRLFFQIIFLLPPPIRIIHDTQHIIFFSRRDRVIWVRIFFSIVILA